MPNASICFPPWLLLLWIALLPAAGSATELTHRHFITSDGLRLHYLEAGVGEPALVFVPGWLMPAAIFERQITHFAAAHRVIVLDPRSQGESQLTTRDLSPEARARDIAELVRHAGLDAFVLAGWSLGVLEALDYAGRYRPVALKGLVLIDNSIGEGPPPRPPAPGAAPPRPTRPDAFEAHVRRFIAGMFRTPPPTAFVRRIEASALRLPPQAAWRLLDGLHPRAHYREALHATRVPVWYAITPRFAAQGEHLSATRPQATVSVFESRAHALFYEESEAFNAQLSDFLDRLR